MASRPRTDKKIRRLRKALRRSPTPYIDLFAWLRDRRYVQTNGQARSLIAGKRLKSESHTVGLVKVQRLNERNEALEVEEVERYAPAAVKATLRVVEA